MQTKINRIDRFRLAGALAVGLLLAACGSGDQPTRLDNINAGAGAGGGGGPAEPGSVRMGKGSGNAFVAGQIDVGVGDTTLSAGGTTTLTVSLVDGEGNRVTEVLPVTFDSDCVAEGRSVIEPRIGQTEELVDNTIEAVNGQATVVYRANGCIGEDEVVARTSHEGRVLSARAFVEVEADSIQTIAFVEAVPQNISIKGSGGEETSVVRFQVRGKTGAPITGVDVDFSLNTTTGGIALTDTSTVTGNDGIASTIVQAGTVATSVRVTASTATASGVISTQSSQLIISTGLPDQNSVSLSTSHLAPIGWNYDGFEAQITMRMADAFNNPVPDGTAVSFTASGGSIEDGCNTQGGVCSVTWSSQNPKPGKGQNPFFWVEEETLSLHCPPDMGECRHGRVRVLGTAIGNESFIDNTGSGLYDGPPDIFATGGDCSPNNPISSAALVEQQSGNVTQINDGSCDDLGEAYVDRNFTGQRDNGDEYADFNRNNVWDPGNGIYDGALCSDSALAQGLCTRDTVTVRDDLTLVMSCDQPYTMPDGRLPGQPTEPVQLGFGETRTISMLLADCNGNGIPAGTEITANAGFGVNVTGEAGPTPAADRHEPMIVTLFIAASIALPVGGSVALELEIPNGAGGTSVYSFPIAVTPRSTAEPAEPTD